MPRRNGGSANGISLQFILNRREERHFERVQNWATGQKGLEHVLVLYENSVFRKSAGTSPEEATRKAMEINRIWYDEEEEYKKDQEDDGEDNENEDEEEEDAAPERK